MSQTITPSTGQRSAIRVVGPSRPDGFTPRGRGTGVASDWVGPGLRWHQRTVDVFELLHRVTVPISGPFPLQTVTRPLAAALHDQWVGEGALRAGLHVTSVSAEVQVRGTERSLVLLVTTARPAGDADVATPQMIRDLRRALRSLIVASGAPLTVAA